MSKEINLIVLENGRTQGLYVDGTLQEVLKGSRRIKDGREDYSDVLDELISKGFEIGTLSYRKYDSKDFPKNIA